jgi:hypothetical protein
MKRLLSLIAILAISLLSACASAPENTAATTEGATAGKMCDHAMKPNHCKGAKCKHQGKHHGKSKAKYKKAAAPAAGAAMTAKTAPATAATPTIPSQEKGLNVMEGVKKIIKDVAPKDVKKPE